MDFDGFKTALFLPSLIFLVDLKFDFKFAQLFL